MTDPTDPTDPTGAPRGKSARRGRTTPGGRPPVDQPIPGEHTGTPAVETTPTQMGPADPEPTEVAPFDPPAADRPPAAAADASDVSEPLPDPEPAAPAGPEQAGAAQAGAGAGRQPGTPGGGTSIDSPASVQTGTPDISEPGAAEPAPRTDGPGDTTAAGQALAAPTAPAGGTAVAEPAPSGGAAPAPLTAPTTGLERAGMFGSRDGGDTSGYGGLLIEPYTPAPAERPYGGYFDEVADALIAAMAERSIPESAVQQITVDRGELTLYLDRTHLTALLWTARDDPSLRFELLSSLSGVDYGPGVPRRLHVVYELTSMTYRRRIRLEVAVDDTDAHVPSAVAIYPTADWHERETWDMFGINFSGHPALTRILMPDDWEGHPQRKDYPLGGIPVEFKGAEIAPPDERRAYS